MLKGPNKKLTYLCKFKSHSYCVLELFLNEKFHAGVNVCSGGWILIGRVKKKEGKKWTDLTLVVLAVVPWVYLWLSHRPPLLLLLIHSNLIHLINFHVNIGWCLRIPLLLEMWLYPSCTVGNQCYFFNLAEALHCYIK